MSDIESLKSENQKLREYISLISSEIEFNDRIHEIKQNFKDSPDLERIIVPILDRINKIKSEKSSLTTELNLN
jgi:predicted  nucleic acid-binding Zn-ribbon protein